MSRQDDTKEEILHLLRDREQEEANLYFMYDMGRKVWKTGVIVMIGILVSTLLLAWHYSEGRMSKVSTVSMLCALFVNGALAARLLHRMTLRNRRVEKELSQLRSSSCSR